MKVRDYIKAKLNIWAVNGFSDALIDIELLGVGMDPEMEMSTEIDTDPFFYKVIPDILLTPASISEGGFSISYDKNALKQYYSLVAKKLGKADVLAENTITDITNKWR